MKAPDFWFTSPAHPALLSRLLWPLGRLYARGTATRLASSAGTSVGVPVICVGNLTVGGTGKTPTVIAVVTRLMERGIAAHVVSRGYGGSAQGPLRVDAQTHSASLVGDEPLLMAGFAPVWVAKDRLAGARAAVAAGAQAIILDDGFQNPEPEKNLSIVVVDAGRGFGNGRCLPAGPLREPVAVGLARADLLLAIGPRREQESFAQQWGGSLHLPILRGDLSPLATGMDWVGLRALAFAGIGRPDKFFASLRAAGAEIVRTEALDDHQPFTAPLLKRLQIEALAQGAQLVTTEKDAARLPDAFRPEVLVFPVRLEIDDWGALDRHLAELGL